MPHSRWRGPALILAIAFLGAAAHAWASLQDPLLSGDPSYRVYFADRPIAKLGNRIWPPLLQLQIWLYHLLHLPAAGLKLLSAAHLALAFAALGLFWRQVLASTPLALLAVAAFALHPLTSPTYDLMTEPLGFALLFSLAAWLWHRPAPHWLAFTLAAALLLTRDSYWFYLAALAASSPRRSRLFPLFAIPALWLGLAVPAIYWFGYHRLPAFPAEWPLMVNPSAMAPTFAATAASLLAALFASRTIFLAAAVALAALLARPAQSSHPIASPIRRAAPLALLAVYVLLLAVDPWQETPGNPRQAAPLLEIALLLAPVLIHSAPAHRRALATAAVAAGLLLGVRLPALPPDPTPIRLAHTRLSGLIPVSTPVCLVSSDRWAVFQHLGLPLFHHRKTFLSPSTPVPDHCQAIVSHQAPLSLPGFPLRETLTTGPNRWFVHLPAPRRHSAVPNRSQRSGRVPSNSQSQITDERL